MSTQAPVNVYLDTPSIPLPDWDKEATHWEKINIDSGGDQNFYPLTIKGAYVLGVIHTICQSVDILLHAEDQKHITYIPAYGLFASSIELLGRCVNGNDSTRDSSRDLETGYKWIASSIYDSYRKDHNSVPILVVLVQTNHFLYTIDNLVALRHFAAHGQATTSVIPGCGYRFGNIDYEILSHMPSLLGSGLEKFWADLQISEDLCNNLAKANIIPLRKWPVLQSWYNFSKDDTGKYRSLVDIFSLFNWDIR